MLLGAKLCVYTCIVLFFVVERCIVGVSPGTWHLHSLNWEHYFRELLTTVLLSEDSPTLLRCAERYPRFGVIEAD